MDSVQLNFPHAHSKHHFQKTVPHHQAQEAAKLIFATSFFNTYKQEYIDQKTGFKYGLLYVYNVTVIGCKKLYTVVIFVVQHVALLIIIPYNYTLGKLLKSTVYPYNPISGEHHFVFVPRGVEKFLGDWFFYPSSTWGMRKTLQAIGDSTIEQEVTKAFNTIKDRNADLLNPQGATPFDYRVTTVRSSEVNAFCVPGGGMVVYSQIVKELHGGLKAIKESTITLADGSKVTVDLSGVTLQDALGALMGHEMTHAASRHSMASMTARFLFSMVLKLGRLMLLASLVDKSKEKEKEEDAHKPLLMERFLSWSENRVGHIADLIRGRRCEYESDVTGTYFVRQADLNPLGALFLLEVLSQTQNPLSQFFHRHFEFLFTHPCDENRKQAVFAAIAEIAPDKLKFKKWEKGPEVYDDSSSPALQYCADLKAAFSNKASC